MNIIKNRYLYFLISLLVIIPGCHETPAHSASVLQA